MIRSTTPSRTIQPRGSVLVMSLLVVTIAAFVGTSVIFFADADRRAAQVGVKRTQARAMAWSGVQAVMAQLSKQRETLLAGEAPEVNAAWVVPTDQNTPNAPRWGFRLLKVYGRTVTSEMGKLDINSAPPEMLAKAPGMTDALAQAIAGARTSRKFTSLGELTHVSGFSERLVFGTGGASKDAPAGAAPTAAGEEPAPASNEAGSESGSTVSVVRPLSAYLTVFSFDPEVQVGMGPKSSASAGKQRINLNVPWSEELGTAIEERFDKNVANAVKGIIEGGQSFKKPSDLVKKLREFKVEPKDWLEVMDAFTTNPDQYRLGVVDLLTAPREVLSCVPGVGSDAASQIVERRAKLDAERHQTVVWPVLEGILKPEEFELAVDYLTSRSLQWSVVVEGGIYPPSDEGSGTDAGEEWAQTGMGGLEGDGEGSRGPSVEPLRERVVLEAVIDVSSLRPVVAYLRDVTYLPVARGLAADAERARKGASEPEVDGDQKANEDREISSPSGGKSLPDGFHTELNTSTLQQSELTGHSDPASGKEGDGKPEGDSGDSGTENQRGPSGGETKKVPPPAARDRRVGRWTTGSGGTQP